MHRDLALKGYRVLHRAFPPEECEEILKVADGIGEKNWGQLFLTNNVFDKFRYQAKVLNDNGGVLDAMVGQLTKFARKDFPKATLRDCYFLRSLPGGTRQGVHKDYDLPTPGKC